MPDNSHTPSRRQPKELPPLEELNRRFTYDPATGIIRWRICVNNRAPAGSIAGATDAGGYINIGIFGTPWKAHRIAWKMHYGTEPPALLDHRDGNRANNRPGNLRGSTHAGNMRNSKMHKNNTSGVKGVTWDKSRQRWCAQLRVDGRLIFAARFQELEEAKRAIDAARERFHGEFANTGREERAEGAPMR